MSYTAQARTDSQGYAFTKYHDLGFDSFRVASDFHASGKELIATYKWHFFKEITLAKLFYDEKMSVLAINLKGKGVGMNDLVKIYVTANNKNAFKTKSGKYCFVLHGGKIHTVKNEL